LAGLDENGLTIKRLPEVLADLVASEQANIDPDISTRDDELLGQLNNIFAAAITEQWELTQAVNDNFNPLKAEGKNLDDLGAITGTVRQAGAKSSTPDQTFIGDNGATVLAGTILQNPITLDRFLVTNDVAIGVGSCLSAKYSAATILNNEIYTLSVNGTDYNYTSDADATALEILNGIQVEIAADAIATWSATVDTGEEQLVITTDSALINIVTITYLLADEATVSGLVEASEEGAISAPPNSVNSIVSSTPGLASTTNPTAYVIGRLREEDEAYRARILSSQQSSGKGTVEAIRDDVSLVVGATTVIVIENDQITVDGDGRPPKSFEVIVQGGTDEDVATAIWISKPAGIETFGTTATVINDSIGTQQTINYTRPLPVHLAFLAEYTRYDEESFPAGGEATMASTVQTVTDGLGLDVDVIPSRYFGPLYATTEGINSLVVSVQVLAAPGDPIVPGSWQTTKLAISPKEFASTTGVDITITEV
jgi:uncharacterized phage protein gp47/JayE